MKRPDATLGSKGIALTSTERWQSAPHMGRTLAEEFLHHSFNAALTVVGHARRIKCRTHLSLGALETESLRHSVHPCRPVAAWSSLSANSTVVSAARMGGSSGL